MEISKDFSIEVYNIATWKDFLQVENDWYTILVFHLKISFGIDSLFTIVWSQYTDNGKKVISIIRKS